MRVLMEIKEVAVGVGGEFTAICRDGVARRHIDSFTAQPGDSWLKKYCAVDMDGHAKNEGE